ncbi:hypothetical protein GCM10027417_03660 [Glutamicibacter endophyticus]
MNQLSDLLVDRLRAGADLRLAERATSVPTWWPKDAPDSKKSAAARLEEIGAELGEYQERLFAAAQGGAEDSVLLILQGMDTSGKGGIVRHVVGFFDPQGVAHHAFKAPTAQERAHNFLWRVEKQLPGHGMVGVFDRSHYEDVLIHRVQKLSSEEVIESRFPRILDFERRLAGDGVRVVKVMLHISRDEQYQRLSERLERPDKHWKYAPDDIVDRLLWDEYQAVYQDVLSRTDHQAGGWYVVPADHKWLARLCVAELLLHTLKDIDPQWPATTLDIEAEKRRLEATR